MKRYQLNNDAAFSINLGVDARISERKIILDF
jgi:hypothetical protein